MGGGAGGAGGHMPPHMLLSDLSFLSVRVEKTCFSKAKPLENHGF